MDFLFVLLVIYVLFMLVPRPEKPTSNGIFVPKERFCPPHKWKWIDLIDKDGVKHGEKLVCELCGPLDSQSGRES